VEKGSEECDLDCFICGSVGAVCELEWIYGIREDAVDVLETCRSYRLSQGEVENVGEDTCQLVSTCFE
jgi:hypothetical protein